MCLILRGFDGCTYNVGNIKKLQVADYISYNGYTMDIDEVITSFNTSLYQIELDANFTSTNVNEKLESATIQRQSLAMNQIQLDYTKRLVLRDLRDRKSCIIVLDNNGKYWFIGELGAYLREADDTTSTSNYTLAVEAVSRNSMRQLTQALGDSIADCITCKCADWYFVPVLSQTTSLADTQNCVVGDFGGTL